MMAPCCHWHILHGLVIITHFCTQEKWSECLHGKFTILSSGIILLLQKEQDKHADLQTFEGWTYIFYKCEEGLQSDPATATKLPDIGKSIKSRFGI